MSEIKGRKVTISIGGTTIATGRSRSLTINNEGVDVTSDGDDGIQRMLAEPGQKSVEFTMSGMFDTTETALLDNALSNDLIEEIVLDFGGAFTLTGDFFMGSFGVTGEYSDAVTFNASFSSSGATVKAPVQ